VIDIADTKSFFLLKFIINIPPVILSQRGNIFSVDFTLTGIRNFLLFPNIPEA